MKIDRITTDLLNDGYIMKSQVKRLLEKGIKPEFILRDITLSGFMTKDRLARYIVEKIKNGEYNLSIIKNYDFINEIDILKKLGESLNIPFIDLG